MELFASYLAVLRDPSVPSNRVARKAAVLALALVVLLIYYRHVVLEFEVGKPALVTAALAFVAYSVFGMFGGMLAGAFYEAFLKDVRAQRSESSLAVFFGEWLFALSAPLLGVLAFGVLHSHMP